MQKLYVSFFLLRQTLPADDLRVAVTHYHVSFIEVKPMEGDVVPLHGFA
jgi:hypothetical protein